MCEIISKKLSQALSIRLTERDNDNVLRLKATAFEIQSPARQTGSPDTYESSTLRISELVKAQEGI